MLGENANFKTECALLCYTYNVSRSPYLSMRFFFYNVGEPLRSALLQFLYTKMSDFAPKLRSFKKLPAQTQSMHREIVYEQIFTRF